MPMVQAERKSHPHPQESSSRCRCLVRRYYIQVWQLQCGCRCINIIIVAIQLTISFLSAAAWAPASWHLHLSCAASGAPDAPHGMHPAGPAAMEFEPGKLVELQLGSGSWYVRCKWCEEDVSFRLHPAACGAEAAKNKWKDYRGACRCQANRAASGIGRASNAQRHTSGSGRR